MTGRPPTLTKDLQERLMSKNIGRHGGHVASASRSIVTNIVPTSETVGEVV